MIGHDSLLPVRKDGIFLLIACNHHFYALFQICLTHHCAASPNRAQGGFIDDIGQLRPGGAGGHAGDGAKIHVLSQTNLLSVNLQYGLPPGQIRQLHRHPPIEPSRSGKGGIQRLRPVGGRQNNHTVVSLKAVHLREQLVQGLLPLVVAADLSVPLLSDGIDLINEHDAGGLLLGLLEEIPHLGRAHAHKHLHEFRAGHGKEGHVCLPCHSLGQHGLSRSGRSHKQKSLGHGSAHIRIFLRVVQIIYHLSQTLLGLVLPRHIIEMNPLRGLNINLCAALAHAEHHSVRPSRMLRQLPAQILPQKNKYQHGQHSRQKMLSRGDVGRSMSLAKTAPAS